MLVDASIFFIDNVEEKIQYTMFWFWLCKARQINVDGDAQDAIFLK